MSLRVAVVGDVFIDRDDPAKSVHRVGPLIQAADVALANNEGVYAHHTSRPPSAAHQLIAPPDNAEGVRLAGFAAVSCANNHIVDGGHEGLQETIATLRALGVQTAGAGRDLDEARRPAIVERSGQRLALLAYSSVFPVGYDARPGVPGVTPLRVDTLYSLPDPHFWSPGVQPRIATLPWPVDLQAMVDDITAARGQADVIVVSMHMGDSFLPLALHDYERQLGRAAVDAGADLVFGHHHHSLRGVELHGGKPIFYGLGNFAFDLRDVERRWSSQALALFRRRFGEYAFGPRDEYPAFPFHADYRKTAIGVVEFDRGEVRSVGLVPCAIRPNGPEPLGLDHPERQDVIDYLARATAEVDRRTRLEPRGAGELAGFHAATVLP